MVKYEHAEVAKWHTRGSQKAMSLTARGGSTPLLGTFLLGGENYGRKIKEL